MDVQRNRQLAGKDIADIIDPFKPDEFMAGSTDVGDVSWLVPTAQCMTACEPLGTLFIHGKS